MSRSFLFLQGVASPFFTELGKALIAAGHSVIKINYCGGDLLSGRFFSTPIKQLNYRAESENLASFYQATFDEYNISDIVLFGDTRPVHTAALELARKTNLKIHVYEEGYFRPDWVTLDKGGVNAYSGLSKSPADYAYAEINQAQIPQKSGGGLAIRAWHDIRYHAANLLLKPYFSHYQSHRPERALKEYLGWMKRLPSLYFYHNKKSDQQIKVLINSGKNFYLLPLQLDADSQMRVHSPIKTVTKLIQTTLMSFAKNAPQNSVLVIKNHPLDPWFVDYPRLIKTTAKDHNIDQSRIVYLESGDLNKLLKNAKGTVLVNSTVGTSALSFACPVIALGSAIYDIEGLTFQGKLDNFWTEATAPNQELFHNFKQSIIKQTQINGSFYNQKGIEMAVRGSLSFFEANSSATQLNPEQKTENCLGSVS